MYPITNTVEALFAAQARQVLRITGTDKNGASISITDENVLMGTFNIDRFVCNTEKIEIGTATSAEMTLTLDNYSGIYDSIVFEDAELFTEIGIADWSQQTPTISYIPIGYFTPCEQPRKLTSISIKALDRMTRFDVPLSTLNFPMTVSALVSSVCTMCNVPFTQDLSTLPNYDYSISTLPSLVQDITCRSIIQWCAGIMGTNAFIDWNGNLKFQWFASANYTTTTANRFASDLYENDITITGVKYTNTQNATIVSGTDDYAIDMTGNYLAAADMATLLPNVKDSVDGFTYRPFSATVMSAPWLWPMDVITFTDKDGNNHDCAVTNVNFGLNGNTVLIGKGQTAQLNSQTQGSGVTPEQGFLIEQAAEMTEQLDDSLDQEGVFNRLTDNGTAQGLVLYNGQLYVNASYMNTGELNAAIVRIKNLTANDISSGIIHSADYRVVDIPMIYPESTLFPADDLYPNYGERVTSGFAIDFSTGQIYGGFYSEQIAQLQDAVTALQNSLVYPKAAPTRSLNQEWIKDAPIMKGIKDKPIKEE